MIGIDIVKINRIAEAMNNPKFCDRILNDIEKEYAFSKSSLVTGEGFTSIAMTVAGLFSAKEAVLKALGLGMKSGYGFKDITVDHDSKGAPVVNLSSKLNKVLESKNKTVVHVSIAHDGGYATAIATLE